MLRRLASRLGGATDRLELLRDLAFAAVRKEEFDEAELLLLALRRKPLTTAWRSHPAPQSRTRRQQQGDTRMRMRWRRTVHFVRSGQARCESVTLASIAEAAINRERAVDVAGEALLAATERSRSTIRRWRCTRSSSCGGRGGGARRCSPRGDPSRRNRARPRGDRAPDDDEAAIRAQALDLIGGEAAIEGAWAGANDRAWLRARARRGDGLVHSPRFLALVGLAA